MERGRKHAASRLIIVALAAALPAVAQDRIPVLATEAAARGRAEPTLDELRWVARPLVVFADTPDDPRFVAADARCSRADPER